MSLEDTTLALTMSQRQACSAAYAAGVSFVVFAAPGQTEAICLFDDDTSPILSDRKFFATEWLGTFGDAAVIHDRLTAEQVILLRPLEQKSSYHLPPSTDREIYLKGIGQLVDELKVHGGKTVISTAITQTVRMSDVVGTGLSYIASADINLYRCMYFTPRTGCWIVASPELLLEMDYESGLARTMALAGTRPRREIAGCWDDKNIREQAMVSDFICNVLKHHSDSVNNSQPETYPAANVEHILSHISVKLRRDQVSVVLDELSPTPALCGTPRGLSVERINRIECHDRLMYGGYFGVSTDRGINCAVMLRCALLTPDGWTIFAGGGITADSIPEQEWDETRIKARGLYDFLTSHTHAQ